MDNNNKQDLDYKWFLDNYNELYERYGKTFLVIKNQNVLGVFPSYAEGVKAASKDNELGTFIVQGCNGEESAYTNYISSMNFM